MFKRIITIIASFCIFTNCIITNFSVYAEDCEQRYNALKEDENIMNSLMDAESVPDGITPLVFDSDEDFLEFYHRYLEDTINNDECEYDINVIHSESSEQNRSGSTYHTGTAKHYKQLIKIGVSITRLELRTVYQYTGSFLNCTIHSIDSSCDVTGYTLGISVENCAITDNIHSDHKGFTSSATGTINYYLVIDGAIKIWSDPFTISMER